MTTDPSDVSACTELGDIEVPGRAPNKEIEFRNQAVGFGADTALVTVTIFGDATPVDGYRLPLPAVRDSHNLDIYRSLERP
jgi:hypothetical protein